MAPPPSRGVKRKRRDEDESRKDGALQRMYAEKQWCDLSIRTATRTFEVHKAVVCAVCPFMKAACTRGFKEAQSNEIQLPESEAVVEAILQHFYQVPVDLLEPLPKRCGNVEARDRALALIDLQVAADKVRYFVFSPAYESKLTRSQYDVTLSSVDLSERFHGAMLELSDPKIVVHIGLAAFSHSQEQLKNLQQWAASNATAALEDISKDEEAWMAICTDPRFMRDVLRIGRTHHVQHANCEELGWPWT
ncbi:hypothetical protein AC579_8160 [Pseudocercospora musae]|uniref:BTB domain-containing protein n=1 Tax=Pseudocercospora musae TaxID=113226 RepID=A0A139IV40_9PEZI|nr:hypothetical protein AC579_8160 [Pseudocercospora musae]